MLIISKFHDYYDTALAHGVDKACVYQRTSEFIPVKPYRKLASWGWPRHGWAREKEYMFQCVIGFCGELLPMIFWADTVFGLEEDVIVSDEYKFFYDLESCTAFLDEEYPENRERLNKYRGRWGRPYYGSEFDMSDIGLQEFFDPNMHKDYERIFVEHRVPVFAAIASWRTGMMIELNPSLKRIKFMKVRDPYTSFQEIHMFMSGVVGALDRDTAEVGNDDRIAQRGFDKWSFRREPGEKQRKGKPKRKQT